MLNVLRQGKTENQLWQLINIHLVLVKIPWSIDILIGIGDFLLCRVVLFVHHRPPEYKTFAVWLEMLLDEE